MLNVRNNTFMQSAIMLNVVAPQIMLYDISRLFFTSFSLPRDPQEHRRRLGHFGRAGLFGRGHRNPEEPDGSGSVNRKRKLPDRVLI